MKDILKSISKNHMELKRIALGSLLGLMVLLGAGIGKALAENLAEDPAELVNALVDDIAMDGFDVVAYHTAGAPALGTADHVVSYKEKTWRFSSAENAAAFAADPEKYEPQFNGWCAFAISEGYGADVDFINGWSIIDGKLYLNWNAEVRDDFMDTQITRAAQAHANWPAVHDGLRDGSIDLYRHKDDRSVGITHPQTLKN